MKKSIIILMLIVILKNGLAWSEPSPFILLTQPKAGTSLLLKLLCMMSKKENHELFRHWDGSVSPNQIDRYLKAGNIPIFHLFAPKIAFRYFLANHLQAKVIVIMRDIRDAYVSYAHWVYQDPNELIQDKINRVFGDIGYFEMTKNLPIFLNHPRFYVVKYEDLVGPEGGGSLEKQKETIEQVARYLGYNFTPEEIERFATQLYGNQEGTPISTTFRNGKMGSWVDMTPEQINFIKKNFNPALIRLGYVQDGKW